MRVLASGDHHFDEHGRFAECVRVHEWMVDVARRERVDLFLSGGDIYERASTPLERQAVAEWLTRMAEVCPVVVAKGNHDRPRDCALLGRLRTEHPVIIEERAGVHYVAGAAVAAVAWPDRAELAAAMRGQAGSVVQIDGETLDLAARDAFRAVLLGLRAKLDACSGPRIGLGHWMVDGSIVSMGQPLLGMPLNVGLADLALLGAPLIVCSHIHRAQEWTYGDSRILYPGSPFRTDFGQLEEKTVVLANFEGAELKGVHTIATPCAPMVHLEARWRDGVFDEAIHLVEAERAGAEVRFRYSVSVEHRDAAHHAANECRNELLELGAVSVKVEECVIPTTRARAPEIAAAPTLAGKLSALWRARGDALSEERTSRVLAKVAALEEEVSDAA